MIYESQSTSREAASWHPARREVRNLAHDLQGFATAILRDAESGALETKTDTRRRSANMEQVAIDLSGAMRLYAAITKEGERQR